MKIPVQYPTRKFNPPRDEESCAFPRENTQSPGLDNAAVFILGMHRSGTSAVSGVLNRLGVEMGSNLVPAKPDNPKGFYEHKEVQEIHDDLLSMLGTSWDDPYSLPEGWTDKPEVRRFRILLHDLILREFTGKPLWGLKDPRLCRLLPLWLSLTGELGASVKALLVLRSPGETAMSLARRNAMPPEQALALWLSHTLAAERETRDLKRAIIAYEDLLEDWEREIDRIGQALDVRFPGIAGSAGREVGGFLSAELRHHRQAKPNFAPVPQAAWANQVYDALLSWRKDGTSPARVLDEIAESVREVELAALPLKHYAESRMKEEKARARLAQGRIQQDRNEIDCSGTSLSWRIAGKLGGIRRKVFPPRGRLKPYHQIEPAGENRWTATGTEPQLVFEADYFTAGWHRLEVELEAETPLPISGRIPSVLFDGGHGFQPNVRVWLPPPDNGKLIADIFIPPRTRAIRFDPFTSPCTFTLKNFKIWPI